MKIGFTGTQKGMSEVQITALQAVLWGMSLNEFHHGGCIGADAQAHELAVYEKMEIHVHPPIDKVTGKQIVAKEWVCPNGHPFEGESTSGPSDDGRYTYEYGPACPECGEEASPYSTQQAQMKHLRKEYISRNHDIVDAVEVLIAAPFRGSEILRSGTWATVRYARQKKVPVIILERGA